MHIGVGNEEMPDWIGRHGVLSDRGRRALRLLLGIVRQLDPNADAPEFQVKSVVWRRGDTAWLYCYTDSPHQIALESPPLDAILASDLAAELGWEVFDHTDSLSDKLRYGSSVGLTPTGRMRFIVKDPEDLTGPGGSALKSILGRSRSGARGEGLLAVADDWTQAGQD